MAGAVDRMCRGAGLIPRFLIQQLEKDLFPLKGHVVSAIAVIPSSQNVQHVVSFQVPMDHGNLGILSSDLVRIPKEISLTQYPAECGDPEALLVPLHTEGRVGVPRQGAGTARGRLR